MAFWRRKRKRNTTNFIGSVQAPFTGNCMVRQHTMDGHYVGRCYHSTYNDVCPIHGNVGEWLADYPGMISNGNDAEITWMRAWPKDYEL
jgi:hypothetical protein